MNYENGFAKEEFLQYMYNQFPSVYNNTHSRELLENTVNYCMEKEGARESRFIGVLEGLIPEVTRNEVTMHFDNTSKEKKVITSLKSKGIKERKEDAVSKLKQQGSLKKNTPKKEMKR